MIPINDRFFARPLLLGQPSSSSFGGGGVREHARGTQRSCKLCRRRGPLLSSPLLSSPLISPSLLRPTGNDRSIDRVERSGWNRGPLRAAVHRIGWYIGWRIDICAALRAPSKECAPIAGRFASRADLSRRTDTLRPPRRGIVLAPSTCSTAFEGG